MDGLCGIAIAVDRRSIRTARHARTSARSLSARDTFCRPRLAPGLGRSWRTARRPIAVDAMADRGLVVLRHASRDHGLGEFRPGPAHPRRSRCDVGARNHGARRADSGCSGRRHGALATRPRRGRSLASARAHPSSARCRAPLHCRRDRRQPLAGDEARPLAYDSEAHQSRRGVLAPGTPTRADPLPHTHGRIALAPDRIGE